MYNVKVKLFLDSTQIQVYAKAGEVMNEKIAETINALSAATGMSKEAMFDNLSKGMADMLEALKNGETDIIGLGKIIDEKKQD